MMSSFEFIGHEYYPEDEYTKEIATFRLSVPVEVIYCRKKNKDGGLFWSQASVGVTKGGKKTYVDAVSQDSKFLEKAIKTFLENRSWEGRSAHEKPTSMSEVAEEQELPF
jgi:hypothetical protein